MSRLLRTAAVALAVLCAGAVARGSEVWVVQFQTHFPDVIPPCQTLVAWHSHLLFHNTTERDVEIRLLDVSNGGRQPGATNLAVSPHRTASVRGVAPAGLNWNPPDDAQLWVNRLDVPDGVIVANRAESQINELDGGPEPPCMTRPQFSAGLPLKVFRSLVSAGVPQYHLATDIGDYILGNIHLDSRINVGVYNDSSEDATAVVEVRCSPGPVVDIFIQPDPLIKTLTIEVRAHSVTQRTVLAATAASPCPISVYSAPYHVVVTSDQPGFSYVSGVLNGALPKFPAATSMSN